MVYHCHVCTQQTQKLCGCCQKVAYCSRECQTHDWRAFHKYETQYPDDMGEFLRLRKPSAATRFSHHAVKGKMHQGIGAEKRARSETTTAPRRQTGQPGRPEKRFKPSAPPESVRDMETDEQTVEESDEESEEETGEASTGQRTMVFGVDTTDWPDNLRDYYRDVTAQATADYENYLYYSELENAMLTAARGVGYEIDTRAMLMAKIQFQRAVDEYVDHQFSMDYDAKKAARLMLRVYERRDAWLQVLIAPSKYTMVEDDVDEIMLYLYRRANPEADALIEEILDTTRTEARSSSAPVRVGIGIDDADSEDDDEDESDSGGGASGSEGAGDESSSDDMSSEEISAELNRQEFVEVGYEMIHNGLRQLVPEAVVFDSDAESSSDSDFDAMDDQNGPPGGAPRPDEDREEFEGAGVRDAERPQLRVDGVLQDRSPERNRIESGVRQQFHRLLDKYGTRLWRQRGKPGVLIACTVVATFVVYSAYSGPGLPPTSGELTEAGGIFVTAFAEGNIPLTEPLERNIINAADENVTKTYVETTTDLLNIILNSTKASFETFKDALTRRRVKFNPLGLFSGVANLGVNGADEITLSVDKLTSLKHILSEIKDASLERNVQVQAQGSLEIIDGFIQGGESITKSTEYWEALVPEYSRLPEISKPVRSILQGVFQRSSRLDSLIGTFEYTKGGFHALHNVGNLVESQQRLFNQIMTRTPQFGEMVKTALAGEGDVAAAMQGLLGNTQYGVLEHLEKMLPGFRSSMSRAAAEGVSGVVATALSEIWTSIKFGWNMQFATDAAMEAFKSLFTVVPEVYGWSQFATTLGYTALGFMGSSAITQGALELFLYPAFRAASRRYMPRDGVFVKAYKGLMRFIGEEDGLGPVVQADSRAQTVSSRLQGFLHRSYKTGLVFTLTSSLLRMAAYFLPVSDIAGEVLQYGFDNWWLAGLALSATGVLTAHALVATSVAQKAIDADEIEQGEGDDAEGAGGWRPVARGRQTEDQPRSRNWFSNLYYRTMRGEEKERQDARERRDPTERALLRRRSSRGIQAMHIGAPEIAGMGANAAFINATTQPLLNTIAFNAGIPLSVRDWFEFYPTATTAVLGVGVLATAGLVKYLTPKPVKNLLAAGAFKAARGLRGLVWKTTSGVLNGAKYGFLIGAIAYEKIVMQPGRMKTFLLTLAAFGLAAYVISGDPTSSEDIMKLYGSGRARPEQGFNYINPTAEELAELGGVVRSVVQTSQLTEDVYALVRENNDDLLRAYNGLRPGLQAASRHVFERFFAAVNMTMPT